MDSRERQSYGKQLSRSTAIAHTGVLAVTRGGPLARRHKRLPALTAAERAWVLHKDLVLRIGVIGLAALLIAGAVQMRGTFVSAATSVVEAASTGMASAGFGISAIDITGQALTSESDILSALAIAPHTSLLGYNVEAARKRLLALPAIETATIRKAYPDRLLVAVTENAPIARWTVDGKTWLVDTDGTRLVATPSSANTDLPLVIGKGAGETAAVIIRALKLHPLLDRHVFALSRIGNRRWDVLYDDGLRVQLPASGVTQALRQLESLERDHSILERDLSLIDMRVDGSILVRLNDKKDASSN